MRARDNVLEFKNGSLGTLGAEQLKWVAAALRGRVQQPLCLAAATSWALPAAPGGAQIVIKSFMFTPMEFTVKAGATVTWSNLEDEPHSLVSDTGLFRSGALDTRETFSSKFDKAGHVPLYLFAASSNERNDRGRIAARRDLKGCPQRPVLERGAF